MFHPQNRKTGNRCWQILKNTGEKDEWFENYALFAALFGIDAKANRIHSAGKTDTIQLYLGWVKGDSKYLEK